MTVDIKMIREWAETPRLGADSLCLHPNEPLDEIRVLCENYEKAIAALKSISTYGTWGNKPVISAEARDEARDVLKEIGEE